MNSFVLVLVHLESLKFVAYRSNFSPILSVKLGYVFLTMNEWQKQAVTSHYSHLQYTTYIQTIFIAYTKSFCYHNSNDV